MARSNSSGVIRPYKKTTKHTLRNGKTHTYTSYEARIDMGEDEYGKRRRKTVSAKTYKACMTKIANILKDKNEWGMAVSKTVRLGPYAEDWLANKKANCDPSTYRGYMTCVRRHLKPYADKPVVTFYQLRKGAAGGQQENADENRRCPGQLFAAMVHAKDTQKPDCQSEHDILIAPIKTPAVYGKVKGDFRQKRKQQHSADVFRLIAGMYRPFGE